ncbi:MAG: cytochrome c maturation protein CcmE [Chloroflexi bacterium]|nr:cytochrome c maturation protein CcmE [Chloroflexota bacterium]
MQNVMTGIAQPKPRARILNLKYIIGGLIILGAIAAFALSNFQSNVVYYYTVPELVAQKTRLTGQTIRVNGPLDQSSIDLDQKTMTLKFNIKDNGMVQPVVYKGVVPDTLTNGESVVAEGRLDAAGVFQADSILVKCPSRYESETPKQN